MEGWHLAIYSFKCHFHHYFYCDFCAGRYDLKRPIFRCRNSSTCPVMEATAKDFIASGYFAGSLKWNYLLIFEMEVLNYANHLRNLAPGTAECQFLKSLGQRGLEKGRVSLFILPYVLLFYVWLYCLTNRNFFFQSDVINKVLFSRAFLQFQLMNHRINLDIKCLDWTVCLACEGGMLAAHVDGIHKLYTFKPYSSKK